MWLGASTTDLCPAKLDAVRSNRFGAVALKNPPPLKNGL